VQRRTPKFTNTAIVLWTALASASATAQPAAIEQHTEHGLEKAPDLDETRLDLSLGGSLNTGNTESWQLNAGGTLRLTRGPSALGADAAFAYGQADIKDDNTDAYQDTVRNFNSKLRYDFFFTQMDAVFAALAFRWDQFAGLDSRVQGQLGYLRYLLRADKHRLWGEVGYDQTRDNFDPDPLLDPETGTVLPGEQVVHSARGFLGYDNQLNEALTYVGGLEALLNVEQSEDLRLNFDNALRSRIGGGFQLEVKFTLKFDNVPVAGTRSTDTATLFTLIYRVIDEREEKAKAPPCPACPACPACPVNAPAPEPAPTPQAPVTTPAAPSGDDPGGPPGDAVVAPSSDGTAPAEPPSQAPPDTPETPANSPTETAPAEPATAPTAAPP